MAAVRDLILRVRGEDVSAGRTLDEIERKLEQVSAGHHEAKVTAETTQADRAVDDLAAKLDKIGSSSRSAKVRAETANAVQDLDYLQHQLEEIARADPTASVTVQTESANFALNKVEARLREISATTASAQLEVEAEHALADIAGVRTGLSDIDHTRASAKVEIDGIAKALAELAAVRAAINSTQRAGSSGGGGGILSHIPDPFGLAPGGRPANLFSSRALTTAALAAVPILPTVGASLTQGVVGAGALGVAGAGVGAPIIGLLAAVAGQFSKAATAATKYHSAQQAVTSASDSLTNAEQSAHDAEANLSQVREAAAQQIQSDLQNAYNGLRSATEGVTTADYAAKNAEEALTDARRAARRAIVDEQNAARDATLQHRGAILQLQEAEQALSQLELTGGTPLAFSEARLAVAQAEQQVKESRIDSGRAHRDSHRTEQQGVSGAPSVVQARQAVATATTGQRDAAIQLSQAQKAVNKAEAESVATAPSVVSAENAVANAHRAAAEAAQKLEYAQTKASKAQKQFLATNSARDITREWSQLGHVLHPVTNLVEVGILGGLKSVRDLTQQLLPEWKQLGGALGGAFSDFGDFLDSPRMRDLFGHLLDGATKTVKILEPAFEGLFRTLTQIAVAALPDFLHLLRDIRDTFRGWAQDTQNIHKTRDAVHGYVEDFRAWLRLLGAIGGLLSAIFITNNHGANSGKRAIKDLTNTFRGWTDWIDSHRHKVNAFWDNLLETFKSIASLITTGIGAGIPVLITLADAARPLADAIKDIVNALNSLKIGNVSALTALIGYLTLKRIGGAFGFPRGAPVPIPGGGASTAETIATRAGTATTLGGASVLGRRAIASRFGVTLPGAGEAAGAGIRALAGSPLKFGAGAVAAVAFQSLFGKPGSFLGPGIAGRQVDPTEFGGDTKKLTAIRAQIEKLVEDGKTQQLNRLLDDTREIYNKTYETNKGAGRDRLRRAAEATLGAVTDAVKQTKADIRAEHLGTALADSIAAGHGPIKKRLDGVQKLFDDMTGSQQDSYIKAAKQQLDSLHHMHLITASEEKKALASIENIQKTSLKRQQAAWAKNTAGFYAITHTIFGGIYDDVQNIVGPKGLTRIVNNFLTGVGSPHKLHFNVQTLGRVAGHAAGLVGPLIDTFAGGATGGFAPGYSRVDNMSINVRGGEAILRPEDHVPFVNWAINRATRGRVGGLGDMFQRSGAQVGRGRSSFAKGGGVQYALPWPGGTSQFGELDRGIDVGGTGPVFAMDSGTVVRPNFNLFSTYGSSTSGLVYRMDHPPRGYSPSSPYVFIYELFNPEGAGTSGGRVKAGELLGHITGGTGIEMGWAANSSGTPLADALGEDIGARHDLPRGLPTSISLQNFIADIQGGKHIAPGAAGGVSVPNIPRLKIKGPPGAARDMEQSALDMTRKAALDYMQKIADKQAAASGATATTGYASAPKNLAKGLPGRLQKYNRVYPSANLQTDPIAWDNLKTLPFDAVAALAEWAGRGRVPGVTMAQVSLGEGVLRPGSESSDGGFGMWGYTPSAAGIVLGHSGPDVHNPIIDALVMAAMYMANPSGVPPSPAVWHGISHVTDSNAHYHGSLLRAALGGFVPMLASGARNFAGGLAMIGETGPELAHMATGSDVYSAAESRRILEAAARGAGGGMSGDQVKVILNGDFIPNGPNPVEVVVGDRRFVKAVRDISNEEIDDALDHDDQRERMLS